MKFISFLIDDESKFGIFDNGNITDLTNKIKKTKTLKDLIAKKGIREAIEYARENPGNIRTDQIKYLPVIPNTGKIVCV